VKIALIPNLTKKDSFPVATAIYEKLCALGAECYFEDTYQSTFCCCGDSFYLPHSEIYKACDAVIAIGGDGSILHAAKHAALNQKPILGVSTGFLAFMADLEKTEVDLITSLVAGEYTLDKRMVLKASLFCENKLVHTYYCVNDAVFARGQELNLTNLVVECDGNLVNEYRADGLVFATPTGSTAYSLSAGGALADPSAECVLVTPIASHSLTSRPLIFRADSVLKVFPSPNVIYNAYFSCDGEGSVLFGKGSHAVIEKADITVDFIKIKQDTFWDTLYKKFFKN
jgi:NAD+ kinase